MKHNLNKSYLLGLSLLSAFLIIWFINTTIWIQINRNAMNDIEHRARLHSLYLWDGTIPELTWAWMRVFSGGKTLNVLNWFMVWGWTASGSLVVIGWWTGNNVNWKNIGIGWWSANTINSDSSVIGWWLNNIVNWSGGVVAWGFHNTAGANSVVAWWSSSTASNGWVVLWWQRNISDWYGTLSLWNGSNGSNWSFSWNGNWYISGSNWVWIWSSNSISILPNVPLYVEWAVKIDDSSLVVEWEVKSDNVWCIRWYDGREFRTFWRASWDETSPCGWNDGICEFGWVLVQSGDAVVGYKVPYAIDCNAAGVKKTNIVCRGWTFPDMWQYVYPYCYQITQATRYTWTLM